MGGLFFDRINCSPLLLEILPVYMQWGQLMKHMRSHLQRTLQRCQARLMNQEKTGLQHQQTPFLLEDYKNRCDHTSNEPLKLALSIRKKQAHKRTPVPAITPPMNPSKMSTAPYQSGKNRPTTPTNPCSSSKITRRYFVKKGENTLTRNSGRMNVAVRVRPLVYRELQVLQ